MSIIFQIGKLIYTYLHSCLQEINHLASSTSKLPYTTALSSSLQPQYTKSPSQTNVASPEVQHNADSIPSARDSRDDSRLAAKRHIQRPPDDSISTYIPQNNSSVLQDDKIERSQRQKGEKSRDTPSAISDVEVPDNVDEVAMINNVINIAKERKMKEESSSSSGSRRGLSEEEQLVSILNVCTHMK
jgi:hypothetical protein